MPTGARGPLGIWQISLLVTGQSSATSDDVFRAKIDGKKEEKKVEEPETWRTVGQQTAAQTLRQTLGLESAVSLRSECVRVASLVNNPGCGPSQAGRPRHELTLNLL